MASCVFLVLSGLHILSLVGSIYCQWGWQLPSQYACVERPVQAVCRLAANPNQPLYPDISGIIVFTQRITCYGHYSLQTKISISGLPADGNWTYHGLHIHRSGDMTNGCESMGPHFNPYGTVHGSQTDPPNRRHVGDFGNVVKDPYGNIQGAIFDNLASLVGRLSILRRGVVVHRNVTLVMEKNIVKLPVKGSRDPFICQGIVKMLHADQDDLGRGLDEESLRTGNSGRRLACCFIEPL